MDYLRRARPLLNVQVKTGSSGIRDYKLKAASAKIIVDKLGQMTGLIVHSTHIQDRDGPRSLERSAAGGHGRRMSSLTAAMGGEKLKSGLEIGNWTLEIIKCSDKAKGFETLPTRRRQRMFAWLRRCRGPAKDS